MDGTGYCYTQYSCYSRSYSYTTVDCTGIAACATVRRSEYGIRLIPIQLYYIPWCSQYSIVWLSTPCRWSIRPLFIPIYRAFTILYALTTTSKHAAACSGRSAALRPMPLFDRWHEPIIQIPKELLIGRTLVPMVKVVLGDTAE